MALEHVTKRGKRAKTRRMKLGMTQEEVAERIQELHAERNPDADRDKTRGQMISDYERGINDPRGARLELWAAALDWTVGDLEADKPKTGSGDLMESLNGAQAHAELPKQVADALGSLAATLGEKLDGMNDELKELRLKLESSGRTQKSSGK